MFNRKKELPFDWAETLNHAIVHPVNEFSEVDRYLRNKAYQTKTGCFAALPSEIPRDEDNLPTDPELRELGRFFFTSIVEQKYLQALEIIQAIKIRSSDILSLSKTKSVQPNEYSCFDIEKMRQAEHEHTCIANQRARIDVLGERAEEEKENEYRSSFRMITAGITVVEVLVFAAVYFLPVNINVAVMAFSTMFLVEVVGMIANYDPEFSAQTNVNIYLISKFSIAVTIFSFLLHRLEEGA